VPSRRIMTHVEIIGAFAFLCHLIPQIQSCVRHRADDSKMISELLGGSTAVWANSVNRRWASLRVSPDDSAWTYASWDPFQTLEVFHPSATSA
jgi:hypothetical protein